MSPLSMDDSPLIVSVIIPCRNEKTHIESCIRSVLKQEVLRDDFEVIVVDGMSDDGTRDILKRLANENSRLKVVDNPRRITPVALNIGIREALGQNVAIMGAHALYAPNYLRTCIEILDEHPDVCCSGGPVVSLGKSAFGRATALAMSHPLGVGNAKHRFPYYEGYAEGAGFPVFRKETFDNVGLYDEDLIHNHDDEFNFRVALSGGKVFISPRARCAYYVRETPRQLFWQYFQYGSYKVDVLKKHRRFISLRHLVPAVFFSLMLVLFVGGLGLPGCWRLIAIVLPIAYAFVLFMAGLQVAAKQRDFLGLILPIPTVIMHFSYAAGFVWKVVVGKRKKYSVDID